MTAEPAPERSGGMSPEHFFTLSSYSIDKYKFPSIDLGRNNLKIYTIPTNSRKTYLQELPKFHE